MITLDNFESCVPYRILVRGEEYYETDASIYLLFHSRRDVNDYGKGYV